MNPKPVSIHSFTWEEVCSSVGFTTIDPCANTELPLCSKHYQMVYRMKNAREIEDSEVVHIVSMQRARFVN